MNIQLKEITVAELVDGYIDNDEEGVVGFGGWLDIRPKYQREFIYKDKQRDAVISTVSKGFPLNVMYWAVLPDNQSFEVIDGQQRTIAICQYVEGDFSCSGLYGIDQPRGFNNLQDDEQQKMLDYKLTVYQCTGKDSEKLEWFKTINIAGEKLSDQELRNAVYSGTWVTDAKRYFGKNNSAAHQLAGDYLTGEVLRQEYLQTAIKWINKDDIVGYMRKHQHDKNAKPLWAYFQTVITWVQRVFPKYRKEMKGIDWGGLYREYKIEKFDSDKLETEITKLMQDDDVGNKKGIYTYVLTHEEKNLNIRLFTESQKRTVYTSQKGICNVCKKKFEIYEMEADHVTPWHEGGKTVIENCQMLCKEDNRRKSGR